MLFQDLCGLSVCPNTDRDIAPGAEDMEEADVLEKSNWDTDKQNEVIISGTLMLHWAIV